MVGFQAVLLLPQVHPLRSFVKTNTKPFAKNGEMARSKKPAERSGLKTCGFRTERGNRAAAGFCATRGSHRTRPSFQRQRVFEIAGRDPREGKHFPLLVGFGTKSKVITASEKPKHSRSPERSTRNIKLRPDALSLRNKQSRSHIKPIFLRCHHSFRNGDCGHHRASDPTP